jgi:hypothetical protein
MAVKHCPWCRVSEHDTMGDYIREDYLLLGYHLPNVFFFFLELGSHFRAEIFRLENLANLYFGLAMHRIRASLGPGDRIIERIGADNPISCDLIRTPLELGCSPSAAKRTPALAISSLNFIMSEIIFSSGTPPVSDSGLALTIIMKRIFNLLESYVCRE